MNEFIISRGLCQKIGLSKYTNRTIKEIKNTKFNLLFLNKYKIFLFVISRKTKRKIRYCNNIRIPTILIEIKIDTNKEEKNNF